MKPLVILPRGGLANQMIQYLFGRAIEAAAPGTMLCGYQLQAWGLASPAPAPIPEGMLRLDAERLDIGEIARRVAEADVGGALIACYAQRLEYFPDRRAARALFPDIEPPVRYGDEHVVVHVRCGDILRPVHGAYAPMSLDYYEKTIAESGRIPVFIGQTHDDSDYCRRLRARFAGALFPGPAKPIEDFLTIRHARHVVIGIGTFGFLASWMSDAETIRMPVRGLFNPRQSPDVDLLPGDDPRYLFYRFPPLFWRATEAQLEALYAPEDLEPMPRGEVCALVRRLS